MRRRAAWASVCLAIAFGLVFLAWSGEEEPELPGAETPEALIERINAAYAAEDFAGLLACWPPAFLPDAACSVLRDVLRPLDPDEYADVEDREGVLEELRGILKTYGLAHLLEIPWPPDDDRLGESEFAYEHFRELDHVAFVRAVADLRRRVLSRGGLDTNTPSFTLENLRIEGDHALADDGTIRIAFVREKGRWYCQNRSWYEDPLAVYERTPQTWLESFPDGLLGLTGLEALERMAAGLPSDTPLSEPWTRKRLVRSGLDVDPVLQRILSTPVKRETLEVIDVLPARDVFGLVRVRTAHPLRTLLWDGLEPSDRALWEANARRSSGLAPTEALAAVDEGLSGTAVLVLGRHPANRTRPAPTSFHDDLYGASDPVIAMAFPAESEAIARDLDATFRTSETIRLLTLVRYLGGLMGMAHGKPVVEVREYRDTTYTRVRLEGPVEGARWLQPAYGAVGKHLVFCAHEDTLRAMLDCAADPKAHPPLSTTDVFGASFFHPEKARGQVSLSLDVEAMSRVPTKDDEGWEAGGFLWDQRSAWVAENRGWYEPAIAHRKALLEAFETKHGRKPTSEEVEAIEVEVEAFCERWEKRFPEFLDEYEQRLRGLRGLRAVSLELQAGKHTVMVELGVFPR